MHIDAGHRAHMTLCDSHRHHLSHARRVVIAFFDLLQRLRAPVVLRIVRFIERCDPRINIPAVIVELLCGIRDHAAHIVECLSFDMDQPDDHIRHLHAGVIDVVLNFDIPPAGVEDSNEGIADGRVSQMADMRSFVRIDIRVFDDNLSVIAWIPAQTAPPDNGRAIEKKVDVACTGSFHAFDAVNFAGAHDQFFCNRTRRTLQRTREFESDGCGQFAVFDFGSLIQNDVGRLYVPLGPDCGSEHVLQARLEVQ